MSFLSKLGDALSNSISDNLSTGENNNKKINLGDFSKQVDHSAERKYVEEGYLRKDPFNASPKQFDLLIQQPTATVLIKKKMFSSMGENFRTDYMDNEEKLYFKTMKVLFQNKCNQIAALEKLSKIQNLTEASGNVNEQLMPLIFGLSDVLSNGFEKGANLFGGLGSSNPFANKISGFSQTIDKIKKIYAYNSPSNYTKWITDSTNIIQSQFGQGTGVIEITNFEGFNTNTSIRLDPSSMTLNISDPYQAMLITEYDIEKAIADTNNFFNDSQVFQFGKESADDIIEKAKQQLNNVRALRKAGNISFKVNPDTLIGKRLVAIIDRTGVEIVFDYNESSAIIPGLAGSTNNAVHINEGYLKDGLFAGFEGLDTNPSSNENRNKNSETEASIFKRLVAAIYNKMQLEKNSQNAMIQNNQKTNGIRRELRFNFLGRLIVQEQDSIHVYINSKSRYDSKILAGLNSMMSGAGMLQNLNNTATNFKNAADSLFNPGAHIPTQIEKSIYVGDEFPNYLWNVLRDQFVNEKEGTHVYGGIIQTVSDSWSDGSFKVAITADDNARYFSMSKINFQPSVDTYNGSIYDPLTPFDQNFDDVGGWSAENHKLLNENITLLNLGILKKKQGPNAGEIAHPNNVVEDASIDKNNGLITRVMHAPDGLSYRWKKGIDVFTQYSRSFEDNDVNRVGAPNIYSEPFAGLDVMNTISLLISGVPYNFETYYNSGLDVGKFTNDNSSFLSVLKSNLTKSNALWGNFIPFKNLVVDEKSYERMVSSKASAAKINSDIENKLNKLSEINEAIVVAGAANFLSSNSETYNSKFDDLKAQADLLTEDVDKKLADALAYEKDQNAELKKIEQLDATINSDENRRFLRKKMSMLTRRMSYDVRANTDKNLFIVDDNYDKDYDIMAYNKSVAGSIGLMANNYTNTSEKIQTTAELLNMEVFCDTQGHIRARFPQYNRMPSSVFYKMMNLKSSTGIEIYPKFLNDFFENQISSLKVKIQETEDFIRLYSAIMGYFSDEECIKFLRSGNNGSETGEEFSFISEQNGGITKIDEILKVANNETSSFTGAQNQSINNYENIRLQSISNKSSFGSAQKYKSILNSLNKQNLKKEGINASSNDVDSLYTNTIVSKILSRLNNKVNINDYVILKTAANSQVATGSKRIDVFKLTKDLQNKIKERQSLLKLFYGTLKNSIEYTSLDNDNSITTKLMPSGNFGNSKIPEVYEHMIEDESFDDLGPGSGSRFIIKETQIINISVSRQSPEYTSIQVNGIFSDFNLSVPSEGSVFNGGNVLTSAVAVDYDNWRMHGFKPGTTVSVPFLNDPETQCAPYASMLLNRARKNVIRGSITIIGNEYMQPGEVIYIESRGMLFYVESVRHSFSYSGAGSFTTDLDLSYGHTPGEYIPTFLDIIGKLIYKNRDKANIVVKRQNSFLNETNLGVLTLQENGFSQEDIITINNMMAFAKYKLAGANDKKKIITKLELRIYYTDDQLSSTELDTFANKARDIIIGKSVPKEFVEMNNNNYSDPIDSNLVVVKHINLKKDNNPYSPSQKAIDSAKNMATSSFSFTNPFSKNTANKEAVKIRDNLFGYIVDCFISIKEGDNV